MATGISKFFNPWNAIWPDLANGRVVVSPPRNGMDRRTGKMLSGWDHVEQSIEVIFATPFHERVLRRWVGSFVPRILGESFVPRVVTRFFWAIASALDLWEPGYKVRQVFFMGTALSTPQVPVQMTAGAAASIIRTGEAVFRQEGVWYPRGHLGDFTPFGPQINDSILPTQITEQ